VIPIHMFGKLVFLAQCPLSSDGINQRRGSRGFPRHNPVAAICGGLETCYADRSNQPSPEPSTSTSTCERSAYTTVPVQSVWRYAASLAGAAEICRSAYY
jgi:hypothetical protein